MHDINYEPKNEVILGISQTPISNTETAVIDFHQSNDATNNYQSLKKLQGNSQASFRCTYTPGSLTSVAIRIYFYTNLSGTDTAFQKTSSNISSGIDTISLYAATLDTTGGNFDIDFPLMACDGIKITVQSTGTTTSSSMTNIHLALRTN